MLDPRLLEILCCPAQFNGEACHGDLKETSESLLCGKCGLLYPIEDGIPVMLVDHAKRVGE
jgi:uncharacterized protein YbaR (Trm112 family)